MVEKIYNNLFQRGLINQPYEVFEQAFNTDPNYRKKVLTYAPEVFF